MTTVCFRYRQAVLGSDSVLNIEINAGVRDFLSAIFRVLLFPDSNLSVLTVLRCAETKIFI